MWRSSLSSIGEPEAGTGEAGEGVDRLVREFANRQALAQARHRVLRIHVDAAEALGGDLAPGVHDRLAQLAQRRDDRFALLRGADAGTVDRQQRSAADRLGHVWDRRRRDEADDRGDAVGEVGGPVAVGAHGIGAKLGREDEGASVDLADRDQVEVQGGDERVAPAAAAQGPEEVGLVLGVDRALLAVGGDELDRAHAVAGEAVLATEPAEATAEGEAGYADVGRGARHRAKVVLLRGGAELGDEDAGLDPGGLRLGVDLDPAHALGLDQDRPFERARQAEGAVPGPLAGDAQVVLGGEADRLGDVVGALDEGDRLGALVGGEVPGEARLVPVGIARGGNAAGDRQPGEVTHLSPLSVGPPILV